MDISNAGLDFDVAIIGAGQTGFSLAVELAKAGQSVALIERRHLGGSCANFGCSPTKTAIASAYIAQLARRGAEFGIRIPTVLPDFMRVLQMAREEAEESRRSLEKQAATLEKLTVLRGHARLEGRAADGRTLCVRMLSRADDEGETVEVLLQAQQVILNTGTRATVPDISGIATVEYLHSGNWLAEGQEKPEHVVLLGGGYIGLEMAQFYRRMGCRVTLVEQNPTLLPGEEPEAGARLASLFTAEGIDLKLGAKVTGVGAGGSRRSVFVAIRRDSGAELIEATHLFVATGRQPNTGDLGLDTLSVTPQGDGTIPVDEKLAVPGVEGLFAAGDIRGGPMFTHTSWDDYRVLRARFLGKNGPEGGHTTTTGRIVPYAIFTDPQFARVGKTEPEARAAGHRVRVGSFELKDNGHANEFRETAGFIKVVVDEESGQVLGATLLCAQASELVHLFLTLMVVGAPYTALRDAIIVHPTLSEAVQGAVAF